MMIEVKKTVAGRGFSYRPGPHDVPKELAEDLIRAGHAEKVKGRDRKKSGEDEAKDAEE